MTDKSTFKSSDPYAFVDEVVPVGTMFLPGAVGKTIVSAEHNLCCILGVTIFSAMIVRFLKDKAESQ